MNGVNYILLTRNNFLTMKTLTTTEHHSRSACRIAGSVVCSEIAAGVSFSNLAPLGNKK
jgi:hypothetical protein